MNKFISAAVLAVALTTAANAQPPLPLAGGLVTHNGSLMSVEVLPDGLVRIRYVDPRPAMRPFVTPGVLLVEGRWLNPGTFAGVSHSFWCGLAYPYQVTGSLDPAGVLTLFGPAPIIDPYSCRVLGYEWTGNSTLVFAPYGPPPAPPPPPIEDDLK